MALPLLFPLAMYILCGLTATGIIGGVAYWAIKRKDKIVFLSGKSGAGKTTLLNVLKLAKGEVLKEDERKETPSNKENAIELKIGKLKYGFTDTNGSEFNRKSIEKLKDKLTKEYKNKDKVVEFYVFDASVYDEKEKNSIKAFKEEADERGFKFVALGTHKDKIDEQKEQYIKDDIKAYCYYQIFQLTNNNQAKNEIEEFIKRISQ